MVLSVKQFPIFFKNSSLVFNKYGKCIVNAVTLAVIIFHNLKSTQEYLMVLFVSFFFFFSRNSSLIFNKYGNALKNKRE